jgi:ComF family protein
VFDIFLDFLFPNKCVGCDVEGVFLCAECKDRFDFVDQICPMCGEDSPMGWTHGPCKTKMGMDGLIVIYEFQEETMKKTINGIKFGFNKSLVDFVLENFSFETGESFDYLVPVPLFYYRENWRGFNQAEVIGNAMGKLMKIPVEKVLRRSRMTKQQSLMKTKTEREKNIEGAFELSKKWKGELRGKKVLLVDDVFTSGVDMRECTKVLKKAGVKLVWGLALAH